MASTQNFPVSPGTLTAAEVSMLVGKDNPVILEIGANSGQTTVEFLKAMPSARIFAFEPDPRAIAKFRNTVSSPNVRLFECAIGSVNGTVSFHQSSGAEHLPDYPEGWDQSGSIRRPHNHLKAWPWVKFDRQITVPVMTLDSWSAQYGITEADFIWADVQGAEGELADGGARFLKSTRYFYSEYSDYEIYEGQISLEALWKKLPDFELLKRFQEDALFMNINVAAS